MGGAKKKTIEDPHVGKLRGKGFIDTPVVLSNFRNVGSTEIAFQHQ